MKLLVFIFLSTLAGLALAYFGGLIVPEGATGVRLKRGVATGQKITQGIYVNIPGLYEIQVFSGAIHTSQMAVSDDRHLCEPFLGEKLEILWCIVDGRLFWPLRAANSKASNTELGENQISGKICALNEGLRTASVQSGNPPLNLEDGSAERFLNESLMPGFGIRVLRISRRRS